MSVEAFLKRYARKTSPAQNRLPPALARAMGLKDPDDRREELGSRSLGPARADEAGAFSIAPIVVGMDVALDDDRGAVIGIEDGRIVWVDERGATHFTLSHYLERG